MHDLRYAEWWYLFRQESGSDTSGKTDMFLLASVSLSDIVFVYWAHLQ